MMSSTHLFDRAAALWNPDWKSVFLLSDPGKIPQSDRPLYFMEDAKRVDIPVHDNGEALVDLKKLDQKSLPILFSSGTTAYGAQGDAFRLRAGAADRLFAAAEDLLDRRSGAITFRITDAFRPIALQRKYYHEIRNKLIMDGFEGDELKQRVAWVIADPDLIPPHVTGAAVDLTLAFVETGKDLNMSTQVDDVENDKIYMWHPELTLEEKQNRMLLYEVLTSAGFVSCAGEWWHFSFGDQEWAWRTGNEYAVYGIVQSN